MDDLIGLFQTSHFMSGLRLGIVALAMGWALRFIIGRDRPPLPIAGALIAVAVAGALYLTEDQLGPLVPALAAIAAGVLLVRLFHLPTWLSIIAAVPGTAWLAFWAPLTEHMWVRVLMVIVVPLGGFLTHHFETRYGRLGLGVVFFTLAALGAFAAVPDTEQALTLIAVALPVTLLAWPKVAASLGMEGGVLALAVLFFVTAEGGGGRPPSIAGSVACIGFLVIEPILVWMRPRLAELVYRVRHNWLGPVVASIPQFILVIICSRIAARFSVLLPAVLIIGAAYALAIWLGLYVAARQPDPADSAIVSV